MKGGMRHEASLERDPSGGGGNSSVGCVSSQKRSVGSVGHFDRLGTLRVACSHHAYRACTDIVTCGFAHDWYSVPI